MALDASMDAALQGAAPLVCSLVEIVLPDHTIRVADGAAQITYDGAVFSGEDATYGILNGVEALSEQVGTEAPKVRFTFLPTSLDALAAITAPGLQGSEVSLWFGAVNPTTGLLIGEPELLFLGELDTAEFDTDTTSTVITFDVASAWERLFEANEGARLNNAFHQSIWSGERGFEFVTQVQRQEPWGYDAARPRVVADVIGGQPGQPGQGGVGGPRGSNGCSAPETPFQMAPGVTIPAGDVLSGDFAWTRHHVTGAWGFHTVLAAARLEDRERWKVEFADGRNPFIATPDHLFETGDFDPVAWTRLDALKPGDRIAGPLAGVVRAVGFHDVGPVIRFTVRDAESYVAAGLQSHNKRPVF